MSNSFAFCVIGLFAASHHQRQAGAGAFQRMGACRLVRCRLCFRSCLCVCLHCRNCSCVFAGCANTFVFPFDVRPMLYASLSVFLFLICFVCLCSDGNIGGRAASRVRRVPSHLRRPGVPGQRIALSVCCMFCAELQGSSFLFVVSIISFARFRCLLLSFRLCVCSLACCTELIC